MIFNRQFETMSRTALKELQSKQLSNLIRRVYKNNAFYRDKMDASHVKPADIKIIKDIV
jgi:phenylacetate-CoA ligase